MANKLILQDVGLQAINNANAGGILINPTYFKAGDSRLNPTMENATDIIGNIVVQGGIHHIEVVSQQSARFFFEIDGQSVSEATEIKELGVFLNDNFILGRCVFDDPIVIVPNEIIQISVILSTGRADLSTINVSIGNYESIPVTPFLYRLPSPYASQFNSIIVANGMTNVDGTDSPLMAMRYGSGSFQWGFTGHTRVYASKPATATDSTFTIANPTAFFDHELVIVHVVNGAGAGQTRRYYYDLGSTTFIDADGQVLADLENCTIAIWKATGVGIYISEASAGTDGTDGTNGLPGADGNGGIPGLPGTEGANGSGGGGTGGGTGGGFTTVPSTENIPHDWVLVSGPGDKPVWAPQKSGAKVLNTLFTPPSRLDINVLNFIGQGDTARYSLGALVVENANYIYPALGGVTQHRSAFDLNASEIEFAEEIPNAVPVDLRIFTKSPSTGSRLAFWTDHAIGDGITTTFKLTKPITDAKYVFAFMQGTLQSVTGYSYNAATQEITFVEPPLAGLPLEFRSFWHEVETGYSTRIVSQTYMVTGETLFLSLPITPQSQSQVFLSHSGTHVHDDLYTLIDDQLILSGSLVEGVEVEVYIFDNVLAQGSENTNLKGIVYDAFLTYKSMKLLRHGANPITLPIPAPNFEQGEGIRLTGNYPNIRIENTFSQAAETNPFKRYSNVQIEKDASQVLTTHRIDITGDSIILVTCDFAAKIGPGFVSTEGMENIEFVVGMRSVNTKEPDYGKQILGTGSAGFSSLAAEKTEVAYANASLTRVFEIVKDNHPAGYVDIVGKMRVNNANISQFGSRLSVNINVVEIPKWK